MKTQVLRLTKIFHFEMAHALYGYDGPCKNVHGHSYELQVTVKGKCKTNPDDSKLGMVMDFTDLKKIVMPIIDKLDHATVLNGTTPHKILAEDNMLFQKLVLVNYQPTCENLLRDIAEQLSIQFSEGIELHHLKLKETPSSYAEWYKCDNQN